MPKLTPTFNLEVETDHTYFVGKAGFLVHNGDTDDPLYEPPTDMPGKKLGGTDMDHGIPKGLAKGNPSLKPIVKDPANLRPMPSGMNQIDKQRLDVESMDRFNQLKQDLIQHGNMSPAQAEAQAWKAMEGEFRANANSVPGFPADQIDSLCPK